MHLNVAANLQHPAAFGTIISSSNRRKRSTHATLTLRCAQIVSSELDVAIVGGGPGGLASAAAIVSALGNGVRVKVYESMKGYRLQGSGVGLNANAQRALEAIDPDLLARFRCHGTLVNSSKLFNLQGDFTGQYRSFKEDQAKLEDKYGIRPFVLGWHEIRQLLYEHLPPDLVEFDKQLTHYDSDKDGVTLHFDRGQPSVHAKVLVGADGYFSKVRAQCLDDGPPQFANMVMWRARIGWQEGMPEPNVSMGYRDPASTGLSHPFAMIFQMGTLEKSKDRSWTWILAAPMETVQKAGVDFNPDTRTVTAIQGDAASGNALENAMRVFADFPQPLLDIVKSTDPTTVTQHGLYIRALGSAPEPKAPASSAVQDSSQSPTQTPDQTSPQPIASSAAQTQQLGHEQDSGRQPHQSSQTRTDSQDPPQEPPGMGDAQRQESYLGQRQTSGQESEGVWGRGRVILLGDAAHATIPNGQGLCLAVEDAVVLAWHLRRQGFTPQALRSYEQERLPRVKMIHVKGVDSATVEDKEKYLFKPTFKPLWQDQAGQNDTPTCIVGFDP
ncbi:TPA: hypothetical protein ACH3X2_004746 [Trebouxia sp. C0005]